MSIPTNHAVLASSLTTQLHSIFHLPLYGLLFYIGYNIKPTFHSLSNWQSVEGVGILPFSLVSPHSLRAALTGLTTLTACWSHWSHHTHCVLVSLVSPHSLRAGLTGLTTFTACWSHWPHHTHCVLVSLVSPHSLRAGLTGLTTFTACWSHWSHHTHCVLVSLSLVPPGPLFICVFRGPGTRSHMTLDTT